ncbi:MAG TPA: DNA polymerase III subunit chi [Steroidobacteraceae bacterium]|nr:DNA polymerase III subunit chi [Steroidobacteraceae bacterium]
MPPRIDFYVLEGTEDRARLVYACRVIEKAFLQNLTVCASLASPAEAESFDTLLWTFADRSFVPHGLARDAQRIAAPAPGTPVWVGCLAPVAADLLVNLSPDVPDFYAGYARVAEFVDREPGRRDAGRRRFAVYRERGHTPETHKVAG